MANQLFTAEQQNAEMRSVLEQIAQRQPALGAAGEAFYDAQQGAKDVLCKLTGSEVGASSPA
jgi:hypothetical protein